MISADSFESRSFRIGAILVCAGSVATTLIFGFRHGICFFIGGILSVLNLSMLHHSINAALSRPANHKLLTVGSYILRLLLIPICLYAIMRFFFWGIISAIAGFAVFGCGIFFEGISQTFKGSSK
jgi:hypothetical protein